MTIGTTDAPRLSVLKTTIRRVLREWGIESVENQGLHSWRCQYPDKYGACKCFEELVHALATALYKDESEVKT